MAPTPQLTSAFDCHVQVIECTQCGAPVKDRPEGGQIACEYTEVRGDTQTVSLLMSRATALHGARNRPAAP